VWGFGVEHGCEQVPDTSNFSLFGVFLDLFVTFELQSESDQRLLQNRLSFVTVWPKFARDHPGFETN
jgi:hypothetical protein